MHIITWRSRAFPVLAPSLGLCASRGSAQATCTWDKSFLCPLLSALLPAGIWVSWVPQTRGFGAGSVRSRVRRGTRCCLSPHPSALLIAAGLKT